MQEVAAKKGISDKEKLAAASQQFEGVLVKQFLKDALKPMFKGYLNEDGSSHEIYRYFVVDALANSIAGSIGFSNSIQAQLQKTEERK